MLASIGCTDSALYWGWKKSRRVVSKILLMIHGEAGEGGRGWRQTNVWTSDGVTACTGYSAQERQTGCERLGGGGCFRMYVIVDSKSMVQPVKA